LIPEHKAGKKEGGSPSNSRRKDEGAFKNRNRKEGIFTGKPLKTRERFRGGGGGKKPVPKEIKWLSSNESEEEKTNKK